MPSPQHDVFQTVELLESILLQLDMRSLLRIQSVKRIREVTLGSMRLQQKLFLLPVLTLGQALELGKAEDQDSMVVMTKKHASMGLGDHLRKCLLNPLVFLEPVLRSAGCTGSDSSASFDLKIFSGITRGMQLTQPPWDMRVKVLENRDTTTCVECRGCGTTVGANPDTDVQTLRCYAWGKFVTHASTASIPDECIVRVAGDFELLPAYA
ncbi:hypothetical protein LTR17_020942 [Elasticomyces elasticus]|nr:hypothetical protein LTR17_020942 [Elasticomyces elasticus]